MKTLQELNFDNSYARLPSIFYSEHAPEPLAKSHLVHFNQAAAELIELDPEQAMHPDFVDIMTGCQSLPGFQPLAMCYAGHQFGQFVPRLGDGRALLLGEIKTDKGEKWDIQLKGGGPTLYSRSGDGRAVLRSTIREYLCSEAMHGLGIPTTRALCMTGSQEEVYREQIETGAMLIRLAPSHVRFGTFEYFYYEQRYDDLKVLANYVIDHHFQHLKETENPCLELLREVIATTARLIAKWQAVGFSHGVMNTDNMSIHSITLDYGPYGFLDRYQPDFICNHSDHHGRYAFNQQPDVGLFNLSCLAQALLPLIDPQPEAAAEKAKAELESYHDIFIDHYATLMSNKLGLYEQPTENKTLCDELLNIMHSNQVDYTLLFRNLSEPDSEKRALNVRNLFIDPLACDAWMKKYQLRLNAENSSAEQRSQNMKRINPKYILRNHLAEAAIRKASDDADFSEIDRLMTVLLNPFDEHSDYESYATHPPAWAHEIKVSCSS